MTSEPGDRPFVGKRRRWKAYVSIASYGPLYESGLDTFMSDMRPKALADLEYTSRDIAYLERHWREEGYDTAPNEHHVAKFDISYNRVVAALEGAKSFLVAGSDSEEFDGGALIFSFSGHGREGDGTLCLNDDTYFSADDFVDSCLEIQRAAPGLSNLRIALLLDSCYSGEFLLRVLERVLRDQLDALTPEYFLASARSLTGSQDGVRE